MSIPVLSVAQMREWEQATWDAGITEADVIRQVGERIAQRLLAVVDHDRRILFVAGKGNNGEDVRLAVQQLREISGERAEDSELVNVIDPAADLPKLDEAISRLGNGVIVEGLFGIGLNRPLGEDWTAVIERINDANATVISIDSPSGLDSDSGEVLGAAIRARLTLTLGAPKRGLLKPQAIEYVGRLCLLPDIGLVACPEGGELYWTVAEDFAGLPPLRKVDSHKGSYGHLAIVAGSLGYHGAAVLAAKGAHSAGAGLVSVFTSEATYIPVASQLAAAMVHPWSGGAAIPANATAILVGPGLASLELPESVREFVVRMWRESPLAVIADASALDWLPKGGTPKGSLRLMTPHPGEAARMLSISTADVQLDRCEALRRISNDYGGCWVALKGHQTLVGRSSGELYVNPSGNPWLAQGGSGDLLAGYLGGMLAQSALAKDAFTAIRFAVWDHGSVADTRYLHRGAITIESVARSLGGDRRRRNEF
jgi:hydroxyethylthiazole kinase-like uncharacterized protein yjeF